MLEEAVLSYNIALEIAPEDAAVFFQKGLALSRMENYEQAIAAFDTAFTLEPRKADPLYQKGLALASLGKQNEAADCIHPGV